MAYTAKITGSIQAKPSSGTPSGKPNIDVPLDESFSLNPALTNEYTLSTDPALTVALDGTTGIGNCSALFFRATGGKVRVRLTSADGTLQAVPVDPIALVVSQKVPFTAFDLTREAGVQVTVAVFFGVKPT